MIRLIVIISILVLTAHANAAPVVTGTPTVVGNEISIGGSGFGSTGPNVIIFDDFERGANEGTITTSGLPVGEWDSISPNPPLYDDLSWSVGSEPHGNFGFQMGHQESDTGTEKVRQLRLIFDTVDEIFISYNFMIPDGSIFPDDTRTTGIVIGEEELPTESVWKLTWLTKDNITSGNDICIPSKSSPSTWGVGGNSHLVDTVPPLTTSDNPDLMATTWPTIPEWFQWDKFTKMDTWLKTNSSDPFTWTSTLHVNMLAEGKGMTQYVYDDNVRTLGDAAGWTQLNFPGYMRIPDDDTEALDVRPIYDDIYVATGPNAAARVAIGDSAVYENCTKLAIQTPTAWSDTGITSDIQLGPFAADANVYVFVIDADNVPSAGVLVSLSASQITNVHASGGSVAASGGSVSVTTQ